MKKILFLLSLLPLLSVAQNIGIGTTTPTAKLTVEGNEITGNGQAAAIKIQNTAATNAWYLRAGANGTTTPLNGFSIADNIGYHFNIASGGNIGIGMMPSDAKFHVNGEMRLQGLNLFEFGAGVAGKEVNAGNIGYNAFGQNGLVFVGGGTTNLNRRMFFYAEGGTVMNGPLDFNGPLRVNGNPGTTGQVLTSNGTGTAAWTDAALSNNVRFAASFSTGSLSFPTVYTYTSFYNQNTGAVTIGANSIIINRSGLYHFEGSVTRNANFSGGNPALLNTSFSFDYGAVVMDYDNRELLNTGAVLYSFTKTIHFSQDIYVAAPATIGPLVTINFSLGSGATFVSTTASGKITGYLISD